MTADLDAERDLIGALIIDRWAAPTIRARITARHFTGHWTRTLFTACCTAIDDSRLERRYQITEVPNRQLVHVIDGLAAALHELGIRQPAPYMTYAQRCTETTLGYQASLLDRLDTALAARQELHELTTRLEELTG